MNGKKFVFNKKTPVQSSITNFVSQSKTKNVSLPESSKTPSDKIKDVSIDFEDSDLEDFDFTAIEKSQRIKTSIQLNRNSNLTLSKQQKSNRNSINIISDSDSEKSPNVSLNTSLNSDINKKSVNSTIKNNSIISNNITHDDVFVKNNSQEDNNKLNINNGISSNCPSSVQNEVKKKFEFKKNTPKHNSNTVSPKPYITKSPVKITTSEQIENVKKELNDKLKGLVEKSASKSLQIKKLLGADESTSLSKESHQKHPKARIALKLSNKEILERSHFFKDESSSKNESPNCTKSETVGLNLISKRQSNNVNDLQKEYITVLEKMADFFEKIPIKILESVKGFDGIAIRKLKLERLSVINKLKNAENKSPKFDKNIDKLKFRKCGDVPVKPINIEKKEDKKLDILSTPIKPSVSRTPGKNKMSLIQNINNISIENSPGKKIDVNPLELSPSSKYVLSRMSTMNEMDELVHKNKSEKFVPKKSSTFSRVIEASKTLNAVTRLNTSLEDKTETNGNTKNKELHVELINTSPEKKSETNSIINDDAETYYSDEDDYNKRDFDWDSPNTNKENNKSSPTKTKKTSVEDEWFDLDDDGWQEYNIEDFEDIPIPDDKKNVNNSNSNNNKDTTVKVPIKSNPMGDFQSNVQNDGITGEFDGMHYPHSQVMMEQFREKFGLRTFRPNQLQVINAALLGNNCFVLMPTGGGKSLCYQLPAILVPGVTIVISPLKSLILDQVNKLEALDIPAAQLSGNMTENQCAHVYVNLALVEPTYKLLYVTPEKIIASTKLQDIFTSLYKRGKLARFIIDEAHCVSQWGHDFRPDYKKLSILRQQFPDVPMMALTATATPRVRFDILHQLSMSDCKWFLCSFNRPNLKYYVLPKTGKAVIKDVVALIKSKFMRYSGIVYCLSRNDCDQVASYMSSEGIKATSYHAGLTDKKREEVQHLWVDDKVRVVCATIAFGMGIDKADVRYVIHHSMPKSVEGYYQEAGRAGRDGDLAHCILYYNYSDMLRIRKLVEMDKTSNLEARKIHIDNLFRMVQFCENKTDCRRSQQLNYFGENFNRDICISQKDSTCDNCQQYQQYKMIDVTDDCKAIVRAIRDFCMNKNFTLIHISEVFKGSSIKKIIDSGHDKHQLYGRGKSWNKNDILRLLHKMVTEEFLREELYVANDIPVAYIKIGNRVGQLMDGAVKVLFPIKSVLAPQATEKSKATTSATNKTGSNEKFSELQEQCYEALLERCRTMAHARGVTMASVMNMQALRAMASKLPETEAEMLSLPHVTKANFEKYGRELLEITMKYAIDRTCMLMMAQDEKEMCEMDIENNYSDDGTDWNSIASTSVQNNSAQKGKRKASTWKNWGNKRFKKGSGKSYRGKGKSKANSPKGKKSKATTSTKQSTSLGFMSLPAAKKPVSNSRGFLPAAKYYD